MTAFQDIQYVLISTEAAKTNGIPVITAEQTSNSEPTKETLLCKVKVRVGNVEEIVSQWPTDLPRGIVPGIDPKIILSQLTEVVVVEQVKRVINALNRRGIPIEYDDNIYFPPKYAVVTPL